MSKLWKPACLLFNFLCLAVSFIAGMYFAGAIDAGKDQGLAGGAIVLGWGVLFAGLAFIASFFITYYLIHAKIIRANWVLLALLVLGFGVTYYRFLERDRLQDERNSPYNGPVTPTTPTQSSFLASW